MISAPSDARLQRPGAPRRRSTAEALDAQSVPERRCETAALGEAVIEAQASGRGPLLPPLDIRASP